MTDENFSIIVNEGISRIPARFRERIANVAFLIADLPTEAQLHGNEIPSGGTLLGLYEGIPLTERGDVYGTGAVLPDTITIFKLPILDESHGDDNRLRAIVYDTVWHEVAHYFGYNDDEIEKREEAGTNHTL